MGGRQFSAAASDPSPRLPPCAAHKHYFFKKVKTDTMYAGENIRGKRCPDSPTLTEGSSDPKTSRGGDGGLGPPLTEAMASLTWLSRWSFLRRAPVSGQMKYTPGTARCVEPSSLGSGTWEMRIKVSEPGLWTEAARATELPQS